MVESVKWKEEMEKEIKRWKEEMEERMLSTEIDMGILKNTMEEERKSKEGMLKEIVKLRARIEKLKDDSSEDECSEEESQEEKDRKNEIKMREEIVRGRERRQMKERLIRERQEEEEKRVEEKRREEEIRKQKEKEIQEELYKKGYWLFIKRRRTGRSFEKWLKEKVGGDERKWRLFPTTNKDVKIIEFATRKMKEELWRKKGEIKLEEEYSLDEYLNFKQRADRRRYLERAEIEKVKGKSVLVENDKIKIEGKWFVWKKDIERRIWKNGQRRKREKKQTKLRNRGAN